MRITIIKTMKTIVIPTMLLSFALFISCSDSNKKLALGNSKKEGGSPADELDDADSKTTTHSEIDTLIKRLNSAAVEVKKPDQLSEVMLKAVAQEFRGLAEKKIQRQLPKRNENSKVQELEPLVELTPIMFDIEALNLTKISTPEKGNDTYTLDVTYKGANKIQLIEKEGGDSFILLEGKDGNMTVRALYTESLSNAHDVRLLVVKKYVNDKVVSVNPFVEFNISGKNKDDHSKLGKFFGLKVFAEPIAIKAFVRAAYDKFSLKSKVLDGLRLPEELMFRMADATRIKIEFIKEEEVRGLQIYVNEEPTTFTFVESFLGLL